ncbi:MAG TPA: hypothetical protein VFC25_00015 [Verrucomicrobiae bacterium]|nr:hypothetical protein [Verrucomicrobiae bacterium]
MSKRSQSSFMKRQKEIARQERRQDKLARKVERNKQREEAAAGRADGIDPDIAGIIPGPQPPDPDLID